MAPPKTSNHFKTIRSTKSSSSIVSNCTGTSEYLLNSTSWASLRRLKVQEFLLSSSASSVLSRIPNNEESEYIHLLQEQREKDMKYLKESYMLIKDSLDNLKDKVSSKEKIKSLNVECYKNVINELENRIDSFRSFVAKEMDSLKSSEKRLKSEVDSIKKQFFGSDDSNIKKRNRNVRHDLDQSVTISRETKKSSSEEVIQFQNFLNRNGGHTGGWGQEEHNIFIYYLCRIRKQIAEPEDLKNKIYLKTLTALLTDRISDLTPAEVVKHDRWYEQYLRLADAQKQSLDKWKALKNISKYEKQIEATNVQNASNAFVPDGKLHPNEDSRTQIKDKIKDWKEKKEEQNRFFNLEKAELAMRNSEIKLNNTENLKLNKKDIDKISEAKKLELEAKRLECEILTLKERERKASEANRKIKDYRLRDQKYIQQRRAIVRKFSGDGSVASTSSSTPNKHSPRLTVRRSMMRTTRNYQKGDFTKPTKQWRNKTADSSQRTITAYQSYYIEDSPKLATPLWRKGVYFR